MCIENAPIKVTCAIIEQENRFLTVQRATQMSRPLKWEFPGGKVEKGELARDSIIREIKEELELTIQPFQQLATIIHDYGDKVIHLIPFRCHIVSGTLKLVEHKAFRWLKLGELFEVDWCEADVKVLKKLIDEYNK